MELGFLRLKIQLQLYCEFTELGRDNLLEGYSRAVEYPGERWVRGCELYLGCAAFDAQPFEEKPYSCPEGTDDLWHEIRLKPPVFALVPLTSLRFFFWGGLWFYSSRMKLPISPSERTCFVKSITFADEAQPAPQNEFFVGSPTHFQTQGLPERKPHQRSHQKHYKYYSSENAHYFLSRCSGIWTATTSPRAQTSPLAIRRDSTMTLRPLISFTVARTSKGTPSGVGRR